MILETLEALLRERAADRPAGSYAAALLADPERTRRKIMEEAFELTLELGRAPADRQRTVEEAADLLFHALVGLVAADVPLAEVWRELERRRG